MGFISFLGRAFFSAVFILAAWQKMNDFGTTGGLPLNALEPKMELFKSHVLSLFGIELPQFDLKYFLMAAIALEGVGSILFTIGSSLGAYCLMLFLACVTPIVHDFYNYQMDTHEFEMEFSQFLKNLSLFGALMFYLGMKRSSAKLAARKKAPVKSTKVA